MGSLLSGLNIGVKLKKRHNVPNLSRKVKSTPLIVPASGGDVASGAESGLTAIPAILPIGWDGPRYQPSEWIEKYFYNPKSVNKFGKDWDYSAAETLVLGDVQKAILEKTLTPKANGRMPYSSIFFSTIKKEGKTTLAGAVAAYWAAQMAANDLVLCLANDQEQSAGRIFGAVTPTFYKLCGKKSMPLSPSSPPIVRLQNGSAIQAIANNYAGNAGAEYGLTLWSELWAYTTERSRRLFEELIPINTKLKSIRWVETYVGFEDESDLLKDYFLRIFTDTDESGVRQYSPAGNRVEPVPGLEWITNQDGRPSCWHIPEEGLFYYHNHVPRMPWNIGEIGDQYRREQKADLRHSQYVRLHENRWQSSEGNLLLPEEYDDACILDGPDDGPMFLAGDASQRNDTMALVGTRKYTVKLYGKTYERYRLVYTSFWDPKIHGISKWQAERDGMGAKAGDMDIEALIADEIYKLYREGRLIGPFRYDPYQMHTVAVNLRKRRVPCVEFGQQAERLKSDTFFTKLLRKGDLDLYHHPTLERHFKSAKAKEYENEQIRIVKGTHNRANKVDAAVATAMSVYVASLYRPLNHKRSSSSSRSVK